MNTKQKFSQQLDDFRHRAVSSARKLAGPQVELADLDQAVQLAILEAESNMPSLGLEHDLRYLRRRIVGALKAEIRGYSRRWIDSVTLDDLLDGSEEQLVAGDPPSEQDRPRLQWDGETDDDLLARTEAKDHVWRIVESLPPEAAQVVRLCFGLDGGDPVDPADVADILDEDPVVVNGHLWAAQQLLRHFSSEGRHRRKVPMTEAEFATFLPLSDLAWYDLRDLNLNNADLSGCDLSQAVLSGLNLWGIKMVEARAGGITLWGAQLDGADIRSADLRLGNLERASLCGADLRSADLSGANLWGADLSSVGADHARLASADLRSANLAAADLTRADLSGADLRGADLRRVRLTGANLSGADLEGARISGADLRWANLAGANLCWLDLSVADLRGASLQKAIRSPGLDALTARRAPLPQRLRPLAKAG